MTRRDKHGYPVTPRNIDPHTWYYEQRSGLDLHFQHPVTGHHINVWLPWWRLRRAVENHNRARKIAALRVPPPGKKDRP